MNWCIKVILFIQNGFPWEPINQAGNIFVFSRVPCQYILTVWKLKNTNGMPAKYEKYGNICDTWNNIDIFLINPEPKKFLQMPQMFSFSAILCFKCGHKLSFPHIRSQCSRRNVPCRGTYCLVYVAGYCCLLSRNQAQSPALWGLVPRKMAETRIYLNAYEFWFMVEVDKEIWMFKMFMFWMVYEFFFSCSVWIYWGFIELIQVFSMVCWAINIF